MTRQYVTVPIELKADDDDEEGVINGIASVADIVDLHGEIIDEGAFTKGLKKQDRVQFLADHDTRSRIGIGVMSEDGKKLKIKGLLNLAKQLAKDTLSDVKFSIKNKLPLGLSIGFETVKEDIIDNVRHLKEILLWEVSVVTFPANPKARVVTAKAMDFEQKKKFGLDLAGVVAYCESHNERPENREQLENAVKALQAVLNIPGPQEFLEFLDKCKLN